MGCICTKEPNVHDHVAGNGTEKDNDVIGSLHGEEVIEGGSFPRSKGSLHSKSNVNSVSLANVKERGKTRIRERPKNSYLKRSLSGLGRLSRTKQSMSGPLTRVPNGVKAEQVAAGWPSWLASVAGEAIYGWAPQCSDSYDKINKIGQGTYSSVYRARDLAKDKIVAMKKVRFDNMDPESVRFMAREICILRRLDHPNVMKLEALAVSRISGSLYLVFEYMEHDLTGLLASPKVKFTEPQIKCYARQMFLGLEHCHRRGVLHRDVKGSNLLVNNNGILKIGDFGLATSFEPNRKQPLTSHVVTLWYRAPELLLGATQYGVEIDMWSAGCILAELFAAKPIMPGRTEVEQMHKIFKLCGSPTEEYWQKTTLPLAASFKSQKPYKRRVADAFKYFPKSALALVEMLLSIDPEVRGTASSALKSEFFTSHPLPCDPSSLPQYPPSKEFDAKLREEEARRRKAESLKECTAEYVRKNSGRSKEQSHKSTIEKYSLPEDNETSFHIEPPGGIFKNGYSHSDAVVHPNAVRHSSSEKLKDDSDRSIPAQTLCFSQRGVELSRQASRLHRLLDRSKGADGTSDIDSIDCAPKRKRIFCSGPLMPPRGNMEDMLKEHERQIQEVVRKSRLGKSRAAASSTTRRSCNRNN